MFTIDRGLARLLLGVGLLAASAGCDDPRVTRPGPPDHSLQLFLVLDPDSATQLLLVERLSTTSAEIPGLAATLTSQGTATNGRFDTDSSFDRCMHRYGSIINWPTCLIFPVAASYGATYSLSVNANGFDSASGSTTVPGNFAIVAVSTTGTPPGAGSIRATWTRSQGAYRYVVALRGAGQNSAETHYGCYPDAGCYNRWWVVTTDTSVDASVAPENFDNGKGPYYLDVYAMNRDVYGYVLTGSTGDFFSVPPAQNVIGGYGGVGAWVRRSVPIFR